MTAHTATIRVRYAETDQMGIVYHANYLVWMEVARVEFCTAIGFRYRDMEQEEGIFIAVVESNCRYLRPARFDDEVKIEARLIHANQKMVEFDYVMHCGEALLLKGYTKHLFVGRDMRMKRLPRHYWPLFAIG